MKRIPQAVLAIAALMSIGWNTPKESKSLPKDDPADVRIVTTVLPPINVKIDASQNIVEIGLDGADLQKDPRLEPALRRLRHVRSLGNSQGADAVSRVVRGWPCLEVVCLSDDLTDDGLAALEKMGSPTLLQTHSKSVTDRGVKSIAKLKNLERLDLEYTAITDAALKDIATLPELKVLELRECAITDAGLEYLRDMKLEGLGLFSTRVTNRGIDNLRDMTGLKLLEVTDTKVTEAGCADLKKRIPGLEVRGALEKEIHEEPDDPKDVAAIKAILRGYGEVAIDNVTDNVRSIDAPVETGKPTAWMKHLKGLHSIKRIELPGENLTGDEDLALLSGQTKLGYLHVGDNNISDAGLKYIGQLTSLRELKLSLCRHVTSAGMKYLSQLKNLNGLDLAHTAVGDDGLRELTKLTNLGGLDLMDTKVTDAGLVHLAPLVNLQYLSLGATETTDAGLVHLRGLKKLRAFAGGTGVTREGLMELKKHATRLHFRDE